MGDSGTKRCVLLSGSSGTGKTTLCRLGAAAMRAAWGDRAATIDTDQLYAAVDPRWEFEYSDERNAMIMRQAAAWAWSLIDHGWATVIITGNSIHDPHDTATIVAALPSTVVVHHVTLTLREEVLLSRTEGQPGRDPERLLADLRPDNRRSHPGTVLLDTSDLDPTGALTALAELIIGGAGIIGHGGGRSVRSAG